MPDSFPDQLVCSGGKGLIKKKEKKKISSSNYVRSKVKKIEMIADKLQ